MNKSKEQRREELLKIWDRIGETREKYPGASLHSDIFESEILEPYLDLQELADDLATISKELLEDYKEEHKGWIEEAQKNTQSLIDNMENVLDRYEDVMEVELEDKL